MTSSPFLVPVYRAMTLVGTALSRDGEGDLTHKLVTDTTLPDEVEVVYVVLAPAKRKA